MWNTLKATVRSVLLASRSGQGICLSSTTAYQEIAKESAEKIGERTQQESEREKDDEGVLGPARSEKLTRKLKLQRVDIKEVARGHGSYRCCRGRWGKKRWEKVGFGGQALGPSFLSAKISWKFYAYYILKKNGLNSDVSDLAEVICSVYGTAWHCGPIWQTFVSIFSEWILWNLIKFSDWIL